jgi:alpha-1,6-mannosyltransferase
MFSISKKNQAHIYFAISVLAYGFIAFGIERSQFVALVLSFGILFFCYYKMVVDHSENLKFLLIATIGLRILFGWVLPNLSQDFYRFIWDGRLLIQGINPYLHFPKYLILDPNFQMKQADLLVSKMGELSAGHFSNYPPINQFLFAIAGFLSSNSIVGSVLILRIIIILADLGTLYFGQKLLRNLGLETHRIFWYLLNPLVILECTGNLHFEGVMLFFLVLSFYFLQKNKWQLSAFLIGISISLKLLPLMLLPLFYQKLGFKKSIGFYGIAIGINLLLFLPFVSSELIQNYTETIGLWFTNFEFNASIYYILREIGYYHRGFNMIHTIGKYIPIFMILFIVFMSFFTKIKTEIDLFNAALLVLSVYLFTATTVHPWYVVNLILLSVFTKFRFSFYWSFLIILSYFAYSNESFKEYMVLIFIEYSIVYFVFFYGLRKRYLARKSIL